MLKGYMVREQVIGDLQSVLELGELLSQHEELPVDHLSVASAFVYGLYHDDYSGFVALGDSANYLGKVSVRVVKPADPLRPPCGYLSGLYVQQSCRRLGVGRALVEEAEEWLVDKGIDTVYLDVLQDWDLGAHRFYTSLGYELMGKNLRARSVMGKYRPEYRYMKVLVFTSGS